MYYEACRYYLKKLLILTNVTKYKGKRDSKLDIMGHTQSRKREVEKLDHSNVDFVAAK